MKPSRRLRIKRIIESVLTVLVEKYPAVFVLLETRRKPLALGIRDQIIADNPALKPNHIGTALRAYVAAPGYLQKLIEGADRIGLDGQPCGVVTAREAAHAVEQIKAAEARVRDPLPPAPPPETPTAPKRIGLADLRRAAQARK